MIEQFSDDELLKLPTGSCFVFDVETYENFFLVAFKHVETKKVVLFEQSPGSSINTEKLRFMLWHFCIVGFNSKNYDVPMIAFALKCCETVALKAASDKIIFEGMRTYDFYKEYRIKVPQLNHIDLIEVAPLKGSLKLYGGRLHCKRMQDLPYDPGTRLVQEQAEQVTLYCVNDLDNTALLLAELSPHIELRQSLGQQYGKDFRSLSDAQMAEAIINHEIAKATGSWPRPPQNPPSACSYQIPGYMRFQTAQLQHALQLVGSCQFELAEFIEDDGEGTTKSKKAKLPKEIKDLKLEIGKSVYRMGIGGLHSTESEVSYKADEETLLLDIDVASYYPNIILNQRLFPLHLGEVFLEVFKDIVDRRLAAKRAGEKKVSEGLKIATNGTFGKLGNEYSTLFAPDLLLQVTLSGQLSVLMLIEILELMGIPVVSGNTDGIVVHCNVGQYPIIQDIVKQWEKMTGFTTEETRYKAIYMRDVNNYIAVKYKQNKDGSWTNEVDGCKTKGAYCERGSAQNSVLSKNPESLICSDAVQKLLTDGKPVEETITECRDIRRFVSVRNVKGGGTKDNVYLGKCVRWYFAKGINGNIVYPSGNKVPKTEGAKPLMTLPDAFPEDVDYGYYIRETNDILYDINYYQRPKSLTFF